MSQNNKEILDIAIGTLRLSEDDDQLLLSDLLETIGEKATLQLITFFGGHTLNIPKKENIDKAYKSVIGYMKYRQAGEDFYEVAEFLYGDNPTVQQRRRLRDSIRDVHKKINKSKINLEDLNEQLIYSK